MILPIELEAIEQALSNIDQHNLRKVCAFCQRDLPGSDLLGRRVSHGVCSPRCAAAKAMGWKDESPAVLKG